MNRHVRKKVAGICLLCAAVLGQGRADTTLVFGEVAEDGSVSLTQQMHLREGAIAIAGDGDGRVFVYNEGKKTAYVVDHGERKYIAFDPEKVAKMAENFSQVQRQFLGGLESKMADLPAEQRERLKQVMDQVHQFSEEQMQRKGPEVSYRDTGRTEAVGGFDASVVEVMTGEKRTGLLYMVPYASVGLSAGEYGTLARFQAFIGDLASKLPAGIRSQFGDFEMLTRSDRIPVQIVRFDESGKPRKTERLAARDNKPVEDGWFTVPEGYELQRLEIGG